MMLGYLTLNCYLHHGLSAAQVHRNLEILNHMRHMEAFRTLRTQSQMMVSFRFSKLLQYYLCYCFRECTLYIKKKIFIMFLTFLKTE